MTVRIAAIRPDPLPAVGMIEPQTKKWYSIAKAKVAVVPVRASRATVIIRTGGPTGIIALTG